MQDRVSLYPGRVRLTPVSGQENVYDMVRADEPEQEGTPLNKANLMTDETAANVWPDEAERPDDPTVNDALSALGTGKQKKLVGTPDQVVGFDEGGNTRPRKLYAHEVGDVKLTVKSALGEEWLLCDGSFVSSDEYPDLTKVLPETSNIQKLNGSLDAVTGGWAAAYTGKNIVMLTRMADDASGLAAGAPMVDGSIVYKDCADYGSADVDGLGYVYCSNRTTLATDGNGVCVAAGYYNSSPDGRYLFVTTDHGETWARVVPSSTSGADDTEVLGVAYHDGTWVAVFQNGSLLFVLKSTVAQPVNDDDWETTMVTVSAAANYTFGSLHYFNGYWCSTASRAVMKSTDLATWTVTTNANISVGNTCAASVANGVYFTGDSTYTYDLVNWYSFKADNENTLYSVAYINGWYIASDGYGVLYRTQSPEGTWEQFAKGTGTDYGYSRLLAVDDHFVLLSPAALQYYGKCFLVELPTVSISDDTYAFIKAKE